MRTYTYANFEKHALFMLIEKYSPAEVPQTSPSLILKMHFPARCVDQPKCALGDGGSRHQLLSVNKDCVSTAVCSPVRLFANTKVASVSPQPLVRNPTVTRGGGTSQMRRGRCACASRPSNIFWLPNVRKYTGACFCFGFFFLIKAENHKTEGRGA